MEGADFVKQGYLLFQMLRYKITVLFPDYFLNLGIYTQATGKEILNQNEMWKKMSTGNSKLHPNSLSKLTVPSVSQQASI